MAGKRSPLLRTRRRLQQVPEVNDFDSLFIWETGEDWRWRTGMGERLETQKAAYMGQKGQLFA